MVSYMFVECSKAPGNLCAAQLYVLSYNWACTSTREQNQKQSQEQHRQWSAQADHAMY